MTFSFHPDADEEFIEAVAYYEGSEPGLGLDFACEVHASIQNAIDYPTLWQKIEDDIRRCLVHRFPYGVFVQHRTGRRSHPVDHAPAPRSRLLETQTQSWLNRIGGWRRGAM